MVKKHRGRPVIHARVDAAMLLDLKATADIYRVPISELLRGIVQWFYDEGTAGRDVAGVSRYLETYHGQLGLALDAPREAQKPSRKPVKGKKGGGRAHRAS